MTEEQIQTAIRLYESDKDFFVGKELQKYLILKHKEVAMRQEEIMHLVKIELENLMNGKK